MWSIFENKKKHSAAVIDIGSSSAAVALLQLKHNEPSVVLASQRIFFNSSDREARNTASAVAGLVKEAGSKVATLISKRPDAHAFTPHTLYTFVRAPWSKSTTQQITERFTENTKITAASLDAHSKKTLSELKDIDTTRLLEASITRVEVNGYPTPHPIGKKGHMVSTTVLASDIDTTFKNALNESMVSLYPGLKPEWRTHTRALLTLLREQTTLPRDVLIIDLATESTDFIVVRDGVIFQQLTIFEGAHSILARIAPKGMPEETLSLMRMFERDQCSSATCESLKEGLGRAEIDLVRVFAEPLGTIAASGRLPNHILFFTIPDMAPWLSRFFSRIDFAQFTITAQPFTTTIVGGNDLKEWVRTETGVPLDTSITLACTLVHIEHTASISK